MKSMLRKTFRNSAIRDQSPEALPPISPPSAQDILRYRYHHGTNLGSVFVLEKWLHGSMFDAGASGDSELDAVTASIRVRGVDGTRKRWEEHWACALSNDDLNWLSNVAHCTTIRLPFGYFTLGPDFCSKTPFANQPAQIYVNAWASVKQLVAKCSSHGIGILLDLHALPGGANSESHSGTSTGKAQLWKNKVNIDLAIKCLEHIAEEVTNGMDGVVGLQLCNEAGWDSPKMYDFYDAAITQISRINSTLPVYISDGWDLERALRYSMGKNSVTLRSNPVIVDTHKYYTFADKDTCRHPQELIDQVSTELLELGQRTGNVFDSQGAVAAFTGEYSCTLSAQTWSKVKPEDRPALTKRYGQVQSRVWQQQSCGSAFWTFKMDWMPGGDWGFKEQVENGNIVAPRYLRRSAADVRERSRIAEEKREGLMAVAVQAHQAYWDQEKPGGRFEHWRFEQGWRLGWQDAREFLCARVEGRLDARSERDSCGGDKIGALDLWVLKRMKEAGCVDKSRCSLGWEWEQGFRGGVDQFYKVVEI